MAAERGRAAPPVQVKKRRVGRCVVEEVLGGGERHLSLRFSSVFTQVTAEESGVNEALAKVLFEESTRLIGDTAGRHILFVGLGNPRASVDALAPLAAEHIRPTADLPPSLCKKAGCSLLSLFCPSVPALTGIESSTLVQALTRATHPSLVIVADAMATRSPDRLGSTIEISERGIVPGSGVGVAGTRLDRAFLGVPVLSIGVPIVLDAASLAVRGAADGIFDYLIPREGEAACRRLAHILAQAVERVFGIPALF